VRRYIGLPSFKNRLRYYAEKILRLNTTNFRGDYRGNASPLNQV